MKKGRRLCLMERRSGTDDFVEERREVNGMKLFDDYEAVKFPEENAILITHD